MSLKIVPVPNNSEIVDIAKKLFKKVTPCLEILIQENKHIKNDVVISGMHRGLTDLYEFSCMSLIDASEDKQEAKKAIFEYMEYIKRKIEKNV